MKMCCIVRVSHSSPQTSTSYIPSNTFYNSSLPVRGIATRTLTLLLPIVRLTGDHGFVYSGGALHAAAAKLAAGKEQVHIVYYFVQLVCFLPFDSYSYL